MDNNIKPEAALIGEAADTIDNLLGAMKLPLPAEIHLTALKESLPHLRDVLRRVYVASTGENPWATHPGV